MNVLEALRRCDVFAALTGPELEEIASLTTHRAVDLGEVLVGDGQFATAVHVVAAGRFQVTDRSGAEVAQLGVGDVVGEIALVDDGPASADVTATRPSLVLEVPIREVRSILLDSSRGAMSVASVLASRLRNVNTGSVLRPPKVIAVNGGTGSSDLREALVSAIPGARGATTVEEIWELEPDHFVVVDARNRAVRADLELLVRDAATPDMPALAPRRLDVRLGNQPSAGLSALASLSVNTDLGNSDSIARLVRIAIGGAQALVLGGGGWRTSATMGVLEELESAGLDYDLFIGVSATSPSAVLLAQEKSAAEVTDRTYQFATTITITRDLGPTATSVTTGRSLTTAAQQACGTARLDNIERPCVIGTTSLTAGTLRGINDGLAWKAVRASASVPVIFPPMRIGAELLVDGGVVDNVPTSLAYGLLPEPVVTAVSVDRSQTFDPGLYSDNGIARRALLRGDRSQFLHLMTSCLRRNPGPIHCDYLIGPEVGDSGLFDASQFNEGFERGRIAGRAHVASVKPAD